jgi:hypothetical protein
MNKQRASLAATARSDAAERKKNGFPFNQYSAVTSIESAGQTARLLSLRIDSYEFTAAPTATAARPRCCGTAGASQK